MRGMVRSLQLQDAYRSGTARKDFGRFHSEALRDGLLGAILKDRYQLIERLGSGGEGTVYLANDRKDGRLVAVKLIGKVAPVSEGEDGLLDLSDHFRFMRQLRACSMIDHPNVVRLLDSGLFRGIPFVVMERLEGTDMQKAIRSSGGMEWAAAREIILQVCDGLKAMHDRGVIHRDIKPANIFLSGSPPKAKIIDFDLAKFEGAAAADNVAESDEIVGTPAYMAPEMVSGGAALDRRLDIYSLGATIYEMLAGIPPFTAGNYLDLMKMHRDRMPRPINSARLSAQAPEAVEKLVAKALAKRPEDRFQTVDELKAAVEAVPADERGRKGPLARAWRFIRDIAGLLGGRTDFLGSLHMSPWDVDPLGR